MPPSLQDLIRQTAYSERLIQKLKRSGMLHSEPVEAAFRTVHRHLFLPHFPLEEAYRDTVVVTHWEDGVAVSSSSQPSVMAVMLEHLHLKVGQRVLEIGTGTGFNAALIDHIVGDEGSVISIDVDQAVLDQAADNLTRTAHSHIRLIAGDGRQGYAADAPFDRIIVTVAADDIASAWWDQLANGGRLVMPLSLRGIDLILALELSDGVFSGKIIEQRNFVSMRATGKGDIASPSGQSPLHIRTDSPFDRAILEAALRHPHDVQALPISLTERELFDGLIPFLALQAAEFVFVSASAELNAIPILWSDGIKMNVTVGLIEQAHGALLIGGLDWESEQAVPLGVCTIGDDHGLAERLQHLVTTWDTANRPLIETYQVQAVRPNKLSSITNTKTVMIACEHALFTFGMTLR